jgi:hemoglobin-like flavoprotein
MVERIRPKSFELEPTNPGGRPTKYQPAFARTCLFMAQRGATIAEMADACDIDTRNFYHWMNKHPELREAFDAGNDAFNPRVERALAELAVGYSVDEEQWFNVGGELVRKIVRKHYPPNVTAIIYHTKNRMPERWRDVHRHEVKPTVLKSSEEIRQQLLEEFKDLIDQGLLQLPAPGRRIPGSS